MKNKIDRLFQDKLARQTVDPTENAWEQVKAELDGESHRKVWFAIAASVTLLAVSAVLIFGSIRKNNIDATAGIHVDQPTPAAEFQWNLPEIEYKDEIIPEVINERPRIEPVIREMVAEVETSKEVLPEVIDSQIVSEMPVLTPLDIAETIVLANEVKPDLEDQMTKLPQLQVQITYKADESPVVVEEDKTQVGKLLIRARQFKPGEMLASIRETKNDFFNGKKN